MSSEKLSQNRNWIRFQRGKRLCLLQSAARRPSSCPSPAAPFARFRGTAPTSPFPLAPKLSGWFSGENATAEFVSRIKAVSGAANGFNQKVSQKNIIALPSVGGREWWVLGSRAFAGAFETEGLEGCWGDSGANRRFAELAPQHVRRRAREPGTHHSRPGFGQITDPY